MVMNLSFCVIHTTFHVFVPYFSKCGQLFCVGFEEQNEKNLVFFAFDHRARRKLHSLTMKILYAVTANLTQIFILKFYFTLFCDVKNDRHNFTNSSHFSLT